MPEIVSTFDFDVNDIEIVVRRIGSNWSCRFTGCVRPKDLNMVQKTITRYHRAHRKIIAGDFNQSKLKFKQREAEIKTAERELKQKQGEPNA